MSAQKNTNELVGAQARTFADTHLQKVKVDPVTWEIEYVDPDTGERWLMDYPQSESHGGGPPRLRRIKGDKE